MKTTKIQAVGPDTLCTCVCRRAGHWKERRGTRKAPEYRWYRCRACPGCKAFEPALPEPKQPAALVLPTAGRLLTPEQDAAGEALLEEVAQSLGWVNGEPSTTAEGKGLSGGPARCPRPCSECKHGEHHWLDVAVDPDGDKDDEDSYIHHPAYQEHGLQAFWVCKHCDAWCEDPEEEEDDL